MFRYLHKFLYILSAKNIDLIVLVSMFTLTSVLEALGIGMIGPFISLASRPETLRRFPILDWIYQKIGLSADVQLVGLIGLVIVAIFIIKSILYLFAQNYVFRFSFNQETLLTSRLTKGYLAAPYTFHLKQNSSHLINTIVGEVTKFIHYGLLSTLGVISSSFIITILLLLLAKSSIILLLVILAILLPIFLIFQAMGNKFKRLGRIQSDSRREMMRTINHGLGGLKETRVIGCESYFLSEVQHQASAHERAIGTLFTVQFLPRMVLETTIVVFFIIYLTISQVFLGQNFDDLTPLLSVFAFTALRIIPATNQLIQSLSNLRSCGHTIEILYLNLKEVEAPQSGRSLKVEPLARSDNHAQSRHPEKTPLLFQESLTLNNITYRYPDTEDPAIQNLSLNIKKGESIALIGKSGSGKTTLVDVVLGLLQPENGDILIDGTSIYSDVRQWQNLIGYIPQSIFLMDDTIERNIAFGVADHLIDYARLRKAIQMSQLEELIYEQLADGLQTIVGEQGVRLSGGQRQRIGIARALYHQREILILDEATSALDNETERLVSESIQSLSGDKTMIIIAHRLTTIKHCDRVYLLNRGRITKSGTYEQIVEVDVPA
jgi:ATP-binding cassette, subfamily B, bacterial PglK